MKKIILFSALISFVAFANAQTGQQWSGYEELYFYFLPMQDNAIWQYIEHWKEVFHCSGGLALNTPFYLRHCARVEGSHGNFHAIPLEKIIPLLQENGFEI